MTKREMEILNRARMLGTICGSDTVYGTHIGTEALERLATLGYLNPHPVWSGWYTHVV